MVDFSEIKVDLEGMPDFYLLIRVFPSGGYKYTAHLFRQGSDLATFVFFSERQPYAARNCNIIYFGDAHFSVCKDCINGLDVWLLENEGRHLVGF